MATVTFLPTGERGTATSGTKILAVALRNGVHIRYGCSACRCGTCGVSISNASAVSPMQEGELALLTQLGLSVDGAVRLACQCRVLEEDITVDLSFQQTYSP
jgi:ferredoxin